MTTRKKRPSTYTPRPTDVNPEVLRRLEVISRVMSGAQSVTGAAEELALSRNYFQTMYHRSLGAMMEELDPERVGGRPPKDPTVRELEERVKQLEKANSSLTIQLEASRRATLGLAEMVREQHSIGRRRASKTKSTTAEATSDDGDDEDNDGRRTLLRESRRMKEAGVSEELAAVAVATPASTLRRWTLRERAGAPLARKRGPGSGSDLSEEKLHAAENRVRTLHGNIGAASLGKAVGIPRRAAAELKARTLTELERERKAASRRVEMTTPGAVRGFDQMYVVTFGGWNFALVSADASIPYRTSIYAATTYSAAEVAAALEQDFETNGAPLVVRLDRAAVHREPRVRALFDSFGVLALHGPPYCPRYYGQLERQNREHREWLDGIEIRDEAHLAVVLDEMRRCLNEHLPRRSLGWCTPAQRWEQRPPLQIDRAAFRDEVAERRAWIALQLTEEERSLGFDQRFAIERTLAAHGLLRVTNEGRC
jgi:hypothetical protein